MDVTHRVIGYLRKLTTGEILDFVELDMPSSTLSTKAVMYTVTPEALADIDIDPLSTPGALHAAEHAAIGLLPLVASCDRADIGGVSTAPGRHGRRHRRLRMRCGMPIMRAITQVRQRKFPVGQARCRQGTTAGALATAGLERPRVLLGHRGAQIRTQLARRPPRPVRIAQ
ncbi:ATP-dependent RNA helicase, DEAD/DEAH box family [Mycobacteroides abscessus subsp. abscessus]|nr:ATP-dependent RNA helicase, DEAD/DEAH box family [Mycobacteroides abscessus subsp. abscessus]